MKMNTGYHKISDSNDYVLLSGGEEKGISDIQAGVTKLKLSGDPLTTTENIDSFAETNYMKWIRVSAINHSLSNGYPQNNDGIILSMPYYAGWGRQFYFNENGYETLTRYQASSKWSDWQAFAYKNDLSAYSLINHTHSKFTVFGQEYDGSAAKTVNMETFIGQLTAGSQDAEQNTLILTSPKSGFTNNSMYIYKRPIDNVWNYFYTKMCKGTSTTAPFTGTLYIKDTNCIHLYSQNKDLKIWEVSGADGNPFGSTYGFELLYKGSGEGVNNLLKLIAHNQAGTHVDVYSVDQSGNLTFNKTPKVSSNTVVLSNDSRLTDSRTPTTHQHGNITNEGKIGTTPNYVVTTGTDGTLTASSLIQCSGTKSTAIKIDDDGIEISAGSARGTNGINISGACKINISGETFTNGKDNNVFSDNYNNGVHYITINNASWAANTAYTVGTTVIYSSKLYNCTTAHTSTSTFDSAKFSQSKCYLTAECKELGASLKAGTVIAFKIPATMGSSENHLKLTISTSTQTKQLIFNSSNLTTQYATNTIVMFVYDGTYWRVGDRDTNDYKYAYNVYTPYTGETVGTGGIYQYNLVMRTIDDKLVSVCTSSSTAATKSCSTQKFLIGSKVLYYEGTTLSANAKLSSTTMYHQFYLLNFNYSSNCNSSLVAGLPVYLVGTRDETNEQYFKLDTTKWWTQTLPTSDDGKVYIRIGGAYDTYRICLYGQQEWLEYMYGGIVHCQSWTVDHAATSGYSVKAASATSADEAAYAISAGTAQKIKATKSDGTGDYQIVIETGSHEGNDSNTIYFVT